MAEKIKLFEADIDVDGIIKKSKELKDETFRLKLEQQKLKATLGETSEEYIVNEARLKKVSSELRINQKQVSNLSETNGKLLTVEQKLNMALNEEIVTISSASKNNAELKKIRNELNVETEAGQKALAVINDRLDKNTELIKSNVSGLEQQKIGIGDYKGQIKEAYSELDIMNGGISGFIGRAQEAGGVGALATRSLKGMAQGVIGVTKASLTFLATPIGAVLGAIGLVLGLVINYLKSTQAGMDKLNSITRPFVAVLESLQGVAQDVGRFLFEAFSNPKKSLMELGDFVKNNIINRFKAFAVILDGIINLDFKKVGDGVLQATTGVENLTDKISKGAANTEKFFSDAIKKGQELDKLEKQLEQVRIRNTTQLGIQTEEVKAQNRIAEDQTKTLAERELATIKSIEAAKEINKLKNEELDIEIAILKNKQDRNDTTNEEKRELAELIAKKNENNAAELELETTQNNKLVAIRKQAQSEALALQKEATAKALAEQEAQLQLFINQQGIKKKSLEDQLKFAQDVFDREKKLLEANLKAKNITQTQYESELLSLQNELAKQRTDATIEQYERELNIFINNNQSKIDNETYFSEESLRIEQQRLDDIAQKQRDFNKEKLDSGVINQQDYNDAINLVDEENRLAKLEAKKLREEAQKESDAIDLENQRILDEEKFQSKLELDLARLKLQEEQELANAKSKGANEALIVSKYANIKKEIEQEAANAKLQANASVAGEIAGLLGQESALGKAAALVQAGINIQQGITKAIAQGGLAGIATGAVVAAKGAISVQKIAGATTKFEDGGAFKIGGKRHSQGGTKFLGEDGSSFEAEKDETMFILNRKASAALSPMLSKINQQYGGVPLSTSSAYLESGGQVLRGVKSNVSIKSSEVDYDKLTRMVSEGVRAGAEAGSMSGSSRGTYSGIKDREDYLAIESGANF